MARTAARFRGFGTYRGDREPGLAVVRNKLLGIARTTCIKLCSERLAVFARGLAELMGSIILRRRKPGDQADANTSFRRRPGLAGIALGVRPSALGPYWKQIGRAS